MKKERFTICMLSCINLLFVREEQIPIFDIIFLQDRIFTIAFNNYSLYLTQDLLLRRYY